ncbi:hypothetical protein D3C76_1405110 [compost metagenome]
MLTPGAISKLGAQFKLFGIDPVESGLPDEVTQRIKFSRISLTIVVGVYVVV